MEKVLNQIKEFIGKDGYVPFEHGFKPKYQLNGYRIYAVTQYYVFAIKGHKALLEELTKNDLETIYKDLNRYLKYCQEEA
jgi:hypothetical protein